MKKTKQRVLLIAVTLLMKAQTTHSQTSTLYEDWVNHQYDGTSTLPTFSYAGYAYGDKSIPTIAELTSDGAKIFLVAADGNDMIDDKLKIREAITAAENYIKENPQNKAIVKFPPGKFYVNTTTDNSSIISITENNIVIQGSGSGSGGTELIHSQYLESTNGADYNCPYLFQFKSDDFWFSSQKKIATVTGSAKLNSFSIEISQSDIDANHAELQIGEWISLRTIDNLALVTEDLSPKTVDNIYEDDFDLSIKKKGSSSIEYHRIKDIQGNKLIFHEPILKPVSGNDWGIYSFNELKEVGIQDLKYTGGFTSKHMHHSTSSKTLIDLGETVNTANRKKYSYLGTSGWSGIEFNGVVNGWIKNVVFSQMSQCVLFKNSANCTAINNEYKGDYPGHNFITAASSTKCLIALNEDNSTGNNIAVDNADSGSIFFRNNGKGIWHGAGVSKQSIGNVIYRNTHPMDGHTGMEMHASQPRANLFDNCKGGIFFHAGGNETEVPNHLKKLVLWNFEGTGNDAGRGETGTIDFWVNNERYNTMAIQPILVGTKGITFSDPDDCEIIESNGTKVTHAIIGDKNHNIESIYEAQLAYRRNNNLPEWMYDSLDHLENQEYLEDFELSEADDSWGGTLIGRNNVTWSLTDTKKTSGTYVNGSKCIYIQSLNKPNNQIESSSIEGGISSLSIDCKSLWGTQNNTRKILVMINDKIIDTLTFENEATLNINSLQVFGDFTLKLKNISDPNNTIAIDNIKWTNYSGFTKNETPPSNINNLNAIETTTDSSTLIWTPSYDDSNIVTYDVFELNNASPIATTSSTSYLLTNLSENTQHTYFIQAKDNNGNKSTKREIKFKTEQEFVEKFDNSPADNSWNGTISGIESIVWSLQDVKKTSGKYVDNSKCVYMSGLSKPNNSIQSSTIIGGISFLSIDCKSLWKNIGGERKIQISILQNNNTVKDTVMSFSGTASTNLIFDNINISGDFNLHIKNVSSDTDSNTIAIDNIKWRTYSANQNLSPLAKTLSLLKQSTYEKNKLEVYPNPFSNKIWIKTDKRFEKVLLLNNFGQLIQIEPTSYDNLLLFDFSSKNISSGIYYLKLFSDDEIITKKIIKL